MPVFCLMSDLLLFAEMKNGVPVSFDESTALPAYSLHLLMFALLGLSFWLRSDSLVQLNSLVAGVLMEVSLFFLFIGLTLIPLILIGSLAGVGLLGLSPWITHGFRRKPQLYITAGLPPDPGKPDCRCGFWEWPFQFLSGSAYGFGLSKGSCRNFMFGYCRPLLQAQGKEDRGNQTIRGCSKSVSRSANDLPTICRRSADVCRITPKIWQRKRCGKEQGFQGLAWTAAKSRSDRDGNGVAP
jgi:hypothetical protein